MNAPLITPRYPTPASDSDLDALALIADELVGAGIAADVAQRAAPKMASHAAIQRRVAQHFAAPHPRAPRVTDPAYLCFGCDTGRHDRTAFCVSCGEITDAYAAGAMS